MRKDYHMHPTVVSSPEKVDSFIKSALSKGIQEVCFTDHMPLSVSKASDRIPNGMVGGYYRKVREIAKRYESQIRIKCGIEIDFHNSVMPEIERVLEEGDFDFILASSHMHVFEKEYSKYTFNDFASMAIENSIKAAETGWFSAIAHLDMYRFLFEKTVRFPLINDGYDVFRHKALITELLDAIVNKKMYLEINPHLAESKQDIVYAYPEKTIVEWALKKNVRFSYGSDAHVADSVGAFLDELEMHPVYGNALKKWENEQ